MTSRMGADVLKKFGRYFLLDMVAQGGMAEIYRARLAGKDGAGRILVIKRIQAGFGGHDEFVQMFQSEIKVTMGFNHPNIVQLYDYGEENSQPFIAMEFVDGKNLRQLMSRFNELKHPFPVELAVYIIEQAASGLHYAHAYRDKITGDPLNIVHRDISPQNILVSYEGGVKVIDFGIAKATTNAEATRAGVIKGKPSYLSPEQISGEVLDGRSDVFALGICLWELLCGRKLFAGENDLAVLKLIESCQTHIKLPSSINPRVPKELDYIALKALAKHRDKRFQTAEEFQRALHKFLYAFQSEFNPSDLSFHAKDLFKEEIVADRKRIQRLNEQAEILLQQEVAAQPASSNVPAPSVQDAAEDRTTAVGRSSRPAGGNESALDQRDEQTAAALVLDHGPHHARSGGSAARGLPPSAPPTVHAPMPASSSSANAPRPKSYTVPSATGANGVRTSRNAEPPQGPLQSESPGTEVVLDHSSHPHGPGQSRNFSLQSGQFARSLPTSSTGHRPNPTLLNPDSNSSVPKGRSVGASFLRLALALAAGVGAIAYFGPDFGVTVPVLSPLVRNLLGSDDGKAQTAASKAGNKQLQDNSRERRDPAVATESGTPGDHGLAAQQPPQQSAGAAPASAGTNTESNGGLAANGRLATLRLTFGIGAAGARILVNGRPVTLDQPTVQLPMDSPLELTAEREGYRRLRREFVIDSRQLGDSKEMTMDVTLEPIRFGFLTLRSTPSADAIFSIEGREVTRQTPLENEKFPVGRYDVRLVNEVLGMEKRISIQIHEGKVANFPDERLELKR